MGSVVPSLGQVSGQGSRSRRPPLVGLSLGQAPDAQQRLRHRDADVSACVRTVPVDHDASRSITDDAAVHPGLASTNGGAAQCRMSV
jgi:hypothetical protein